MAPHIGSLTSICLNLLAYDPNYNYEVSFYYILKVSWSTLLQLSYIYFQEENDDEEDRDMETEEEDEENEEEYSDDDDMSWKVRRCAAKCLEAIISTRPDLLKDFYRTVSPILIGRFKGEGAAFFNVHFPNCAFQQNEKRTLRRTFSTLTSLS